MSEYILNRETNKIELHFSKSEYQVLSVEQKADLKRSFLFSGKLSAWVSRSSNNHYAAIRTAEKLGFTNGGNVGERLSYAEELERKAEKAEARAERFEQYSDNAYNRGKDLQSGFKEAARDWSWVTQPIIAGHSGSERFARQKQKLIDRYEKGFTEYRKSDYFKDRAITARQTADKSQLKNKSYLNNRIEECNTSIRALERSIVAAEERNNSEWLESLLEKMEYELDKLAFMHNCMDELGGVLYSKDNVKAGYLVKIRNDWEIVVKANTKTVETQSRHVPYTLKYAYADIKDMKIPEGWTEKKEITVNPFIIGDIVTMNQIGTDRVMRAFQILKTTDKSVMIQRIKVENGIPFPDEFTSEKQERRSVKMNRSGVMVVNYDDYYLYKYNQPVTV
ncbi:DUF3560 domain-containing protein [Paenibacillus cremeus]|uniref:DUF3560 domain-containing protein n=1 Tax=Paenibacillus cremeus TaxID=2163881 RepID=A0A559KCS2_9BACL|nr:DUF3560 domain-containing protein [Paenibacillus cremeus]TVY09925.1 DUF3560 domain-containing protein [Paenibacillus cremeus]